MALVATDTGGLSDTATLVVVVADANDHRPVITNSPLTSDVLVPEVLSVILQERICVCVCVFVILGSWM